MPFLPLDDLTLHYEVAGDGPPLLFIHGLGSSGRDWEPQVACFAPHYRVVTFDVRGHGRSAIPPGPYRVTDFAADAATVLRALDAAPAHVVGLSMGGMIAFQLALDAPGLVRSLTIVNSHPALVPDWRERVKIRRRRTFVRLFGMRAVGEVLGRRLFPQPELAQVRQVFAERMARNDRRAYLRTINALVGWSVEERIGDIRCPVLVVAADGDYTPVARKQAYADRLPDARLVVLPDARHAAPAECPGPFNDALMAFLAGVDGL